MFDLTGKSALITGASGGIGSAIAKAFHAQGAQVILHGTRAEKLESLKTELGEGAHVLTANLSDREAVSAMVASATEMAGSVDILVNNAGAAWGEPYENFSEKGWDKVMDTNVKSMFFLTRDLTPALSKNTSDDEPSRVINIGSIDGINVPIFETFSYSASKAAVHHLTRALASKLVKENILVNAIAPGPFPY